MYRNAYHSHFNLKFFGAIGAGHIFKTKKKHTGPHS